MYCKKCGFNLSDDAKRCPFCGKEVNKEDYLNDSNEKQEEKIVESNVENNDHQYPEYEPTPEQLELFRNFVRAA